MRPIARIATPTAAITAQLFNALVGSGRGEQDTISVLKLLEDMSAEAGDAEGYVCLLMLMARVPVWQKPQVSLADVRIAGR